MEALGEAGWKREDEGGQAMESLGTEAREERLGGERGKIGRRERRDWRRRKEWKIERRTGASLLKAAQKRRNLDFLLRIMLKMLHFNANRNLFCNFVLRTAVITKFSFPKI